MYIYGKCDDFFFFAVRVCVCVSGLCVKINDNLDLKRAMKPRE